MPPNMAPRRLLPRPTTSEATTAPTTRKLRERMTASGLIRRAGEYGRNWLPKASAAAAGRQAAAISMVVPRQRRARSMANSVPRAASAAMAWKAAPPAWP